MSNSTYHITSAGVVYNGDCLEEMDNIPDGSVDLILTDPPYGTIKGMGLNNWDDKTTGWDDILDHERMMGHCGRVLRQGGAMVLFCQDPYTAKLMTETRHELPFSYRLTWLKNNFANCLLVNKAPVKYTEDVCVYFKNHDETNSHPLRGYFKAVFDFIGTGKKSIIEKIGQRACHVFRLDSPQFSLCTEPTYDALVEEYGIDRAVWFSPYSDLYEIEGQFKASTSRSFNLPDGQKFKSNVLEYAKESKSFHPTQKPVELLEDLIKTYSNAGDMVLDFTMGSGSTGVACKNTKRNFIGIERDENYYNIARERLQ